jgi:hypothetical protein
MAVSNEELAKWKNKSIELNKARFLMESIINDNLSEYDKKNPRYERMIEEFLFMIDHTVDPLRKVTCDKKLEEMCDYYEKQICKRTDELKKSHAAEIQRLTKKSELFSWRNIIVGGITVILTAGLTSLGEHITKFFITLFGGTP